MNCIYIDPPYNTGNEGWVYNDAVNDPRIKKWLGQVVGKEGEDLTRHDKWLCMMYPRLKLLHRLLAKDGVIFISIDDNEAANLRLIMDEIFGATNFVANILWQKKYAVANDHKSIAPMHDHIFVFRKTANWERLLLPRTEDKDRQYRLEDTNGIFRTSDYTCNKSADERPNLYYPIMQPNTGEEIWPKRNAVWRYSQERHAQNIQDNLIYWGKEGIGKTPSFKRYRDSLKNAGGVVPQTWWTHEFCGHTDAAKKEIRAIMAEGNGIDDFVTPKPSTLIERILQIATGKDALVLDSFAGSGTTAHAVLKLNAQDGGNRRFILCEMMDYAETITAERVRRVMAGYGEGNKATAGLGGAFSYYTVGEPLFLPDDNLNEAVGVQVIRDYVAYTENIPQESRTTTDNPVSPYLLGQTPDAAWLFHYEPDRATLLDMDFLGSLQFGGKRPALVVVYADACLLSPEFLQRHGLVFKKIPRDITRL
ncbi:site-specific DNA-methyltransferase [Thiothrix subterranea]|uniref:site-specific DNA-methyltransferase (adenine-specific) n=1 Tax=Thiothrix subterranea TaxID=2735563 RepID=A0AA51QXD7_9GAMM|nr:site-specific DNA-methyltransferase [Thiothrix subterranea]MDQ5768649.1 site-specific DNA-methyltransferase [Thiothrix subterranea]WML84802.1 site-specific DNA-methyltransferase [Thiothrix subterranea]